MRTNLLKKGDFQTYSFKDLEHGLKSFQVEQDEYLITKKILKRVYSHEAMPHGLGNLVENRIIQLSKIISIIQDEIANRLLTGDDDGLLEKELLGAKYV